MKAISGYQLVTPADLHWRPSNLMKIPNADYLERTGSENLAARLWRLPPKLEIGGQDVMRQDDRFSHGTSNLQNSRSSV